MDDTTRIFRDHLVALERLALRIVGDREEASDVVGDAFAALLAAGPDDPAHAVPWLYVSVRNRAYNRVRSRARSQRRLHLLTGGGVVPEHAPRGDDRIRDLLEGAASALSERDRIAISLRHLDEAGYDDIAAALGTSAAQARVVVHRATARLRKSVVTSLAIRHGVTDACAGHAGCPRCVAASDEVAALSTGLAAVPLARPGRVLDAARLWWRRAQGAGGRIASCFNEAMAPTAALVAVTAASVLPSAAPTPVPATPRPVEAAALSTTGTNSENDAAAPDGLAGGLSALAPAPTAAGDALGGEAPTIGTVARFTDEGDSGLDGSVADQRDSLITVLGLPVSVPDPLDAPQGPRFDIVSLEAATLADGRGRPAALRWRLVFADTPPQRHFGGVYWGFSGSGCRAYVTWPSAEQSAARLSCPHTDYLGLVARDVETGEARMRLVGRTFEVVIPFASLGGQFAEHLRPGAELTNIVASASCDALDREACQDSGDTAPDGSGGSSYRVEG